MLRLGISWSIASWIASMAIFVPFPIQSDDLPPPADHVQFSGLAPLEAAKAATLPAGFQLHLFAGEPDVKQPIAFCEDDRGRLWVAEGYTYPKRAPEGQGKDRILVFEDTDGDHRFDRRTVFLENLNLVSGIEYGYGGLWVGAAPNLMFIPIADGEHPRPAGEPKILLDGWDFKADTHETLNTFSWGPDGWLYGCHGVFCPSHVGKPGSDAKDRQWVDAAVWRYHPVRNTFEIFAEGTSNPWGVDFDENGQCWIEACVIPHLWQMVQGGRYERQGGEHYCINRGEAQRNAKHRIRSDSKPVFPYTYEGIRTSADHVHYAGANGPHAGNGRSDSMGGGHAHAGMLCYLGTSWPSSFRGNLILGNIHGQRLNIDLPERIGSGFVGKHGQDLINFNDSWSQTLNQRLDPDGSVYVIDWYDKNQCHHNRDDGHDRSNGRIFKIVYNHQPKTSVDLQAYDDKELLMLVTSKNEWMSRHSRRILFERCAGITSDNKGSARRDFIRQDLVARFKTAQDSQERLRVLWALQGTAGVAESLPISQLLSHPDEWIRAWALQLSLEKAAPVTGLPDDTLVNLRSELTREMMRLAKSDSSAMVRRYVASGLQRLSPSDRWDTLKELVQHAEDSGDHNLPLLYWYAAEGSIATQPGRAVELLESCKIPKVREFIARRLVQLSFAQDAPRSRD